MGRLQKIFVVNGKKECLICGITKKLEDFPKDSSRLYGYNISWCNECKSNKNRGLYNKNPKAFYETSKKWIVNNPEKRTAHVHLKHAIESGKIIKPFNCEKCGLAGRLDGHHWHGYDPEHYLDVQWLCRKCHRGL
jgi:hypothetical protein